MKLSILILLFIGSSMSLLAQEKTNPTSTEKTTQEGEIVTFPIKAKTTTDPNYEINKKKSAETQKLFNTEPEIVIKDDKYYQKEISEYNRRIKEINDNSESASSNPDKLEALQKELALIEKEYIDFKESK
jgi:hypothetical protein